LTGTDVPVFFAPVPGISRTQGDGGLKEQVQQSVKKSERANYEIERDTASEASRSFGV
jgi:hypothetical protein